MDADRIEIHTDPLNQNLMGKLDQMRPKADPIPLAKSRALVIATGAAGIALIIAACAMTWGYVEKNKRAEIAQAAQIEANRLKAATDAEIARTRAQAVGKVTDDTKVAPESIPTQNVPKILPTPGDGDKTDIRTTVTVFKHRSFAGEFVLTGWDFKNSAAKTPSDQFCYFTRSAGVATSDRLDLGVNEKHRKYSRQDRLKVKLTERQVLQAREMCQWFNGETAINDPDEPKRTSALASCSIKKIARQQSHIEEPMKFCIGDRGRMVAFGEIGESTYMKFKQAVEASRPKTIVLDSPGGRTDQAYQMATLIRDNQLNTHALSQCNSACVTVMSGGVLRTANNGATFGLHRGAWEDPKKITQAEIQQYRIEQREIYKAHGVSPELEAVEWAVPNTRMINISVNDARSYNLVNG